MKRPWILLELAIISIVAILSSCSICFFTFPDNTEPISKDVLDYVKAHFYYCGYTTRWNDGFIEVYDATQYKQMQEVLNVWNEVIGGSTVFRLSENPNSPIQICNQNGVFHEGKEVCALTIDSHSEDVGHHKAKVLINTNPTLSYNKYNIYLHEFGHVIGFVGHSNGDNDVMGYSSPNCDIPEIMTAAIRFVYQTQFDYYASLDVIEASSSKDE